MLTAGLTPEQTAALQEILVCAEQKKAFKQAKQIESSGGLYIIYSKIISTFLLINFFHIQDTHSHNKRYPHHLISPALNRLTKK